MNQKATGLRVDSMGNGFSSGDMYEHTEIECIRNKMQPLPEIPVPSPLKIFSCRDPIHPD